MEVLLLEWFFDLFGGGGEKEMGEIGFWFLCCRLMVLVGRGLWWIGDFFGKLNVILVLEGGGVCWLLGGFEDCVVWFLCGCWFIVGCILELVGEGLVDGLEFMCCVVLLLGFRMECFRGEFDWFCNEFRCGGRDLGEFW